MEYNVVLLVIVIVICICVFILNVYILVYYQHPDDQNQAYLPKVIVVVGLSVSQLSILMLPTDVANRHSCEKDLFTGACQLTLPMKQLWWGVYIVDAVFVFLLIPFAIFFYEGDQEKSTGHRVKIAVIYVTMLAVIVALLLGILYALLGYADFTVRRLSSTTVQFTNDFTALKATAPCLLPNGVPLSSNATIMCAAYTSGALVKTTWTQRATFPTYVIALATIAGSILFTFFGGAGVACLPISMILAYRNRPRCILTRAQYIKEATEIGKRGKDLKQVIVNLQREQRTGKTNRKWKKNVKKMQQELVYLEDDVKALDEAFPQGEKVREPIKQGHISDSVPVRVFAGRRFMGSHRSWLSGQTRVRNHRVSFFLNFTLYIRLAVSVIWLVHIITNMLLQPPAMPLLNEVFLKLDDAWGLLGTFAFALFCYYLQMSVISGEMHLGMRFLFMSVHPMQYKGTLMNSFLFNVGLILICSVSVIQFCTKAFSLYAQATAAQEIFGHSLESLRGLKILFRFNVFQIGFLILALLTFICYWTCGQKKQKKNKYIQDKTKKGKEKEDDPKAKEAMERAKAKVKPKKKKK